MKKTTTLLIIIATAGTLMAQTQQGLVRTLGRADHAGEPLGGVTIRVRGAHNAVLSRQDGSVALPASGLANGDAYSLQQVRKEGYELNDASIIGRRLAFSDRVPLTIVMVSSAQLQADKQRIENKAYQTAERTYKERLAQLESALADASISAEQYREQLSTLQDNLERYQGLIDGLADHYAHTDYDLLDDTEKEIVLCIENGDLHRADSLIHTLFNPDGILQRSLSALDEANSRIAQAQGILTQAENDLAAVLRQQEKDAEYLYQLYTIALARFDNDKARQYVETRAALDTTNITWQNDAGMFIQEYVADYAVALAYIRTAMRQTFRQYGTQSAEAADAYANLGSLFDALSMYDSAMYCYQKAVALHKEFVGEENTALAGYYVYIGILYKHTDDFEQAARYLNLSRSIRDKLPGKPDIEESYHNLASLLGSQGQYNEALDYYKQALALVIADVGRDHYVTAQIMDNIGVTYIEMEQRDSGLVYMRNALEIRMKTLGEKHPSVASSYHNIGAYLLEMDNYTEALEYQQKAMSIEEVTLGLEHPSLAATYTQVGKTYMRLRNLTAAAEYYNKGLRIREKALGPDHTETAGSHYYLGQLCIMQKQYNQALEHFKAVRPVWESHFGTEHPNVGSLYSSLGNAYFGMNQNDSAMFWYNKGLDIKKKVRGEESADVALSHNNIGLIYEKQGNYTQAYECYLRALSIQEKLFGADHPRTKATRQRVEKMAQQKASSEKQ